MLTASVHSFLLRQFVGQCGDAAAQRAACASSLWLVFPGIRRRDGNPEEVHATHCLGEGPLSNALK